MTAETEKPFDALEWLQSEADRVNALTNGDTSSRRSRHLIYRRKSLKAAANLIEQQSAEIARLREALLQIRRTPAVPFPDRGTSTWKVYAETVLCAWREIQRIAREALSTLPGEKQS